MTMSANEKTFEIAKLRHDVGWWVAELEKATNPFLREYCRRSLDETVRELKALQDA